MDAFIQAPRQQKSPRRHSFEEELAHEVRGTLEGMVRGLDLLRSSEAECPTVRRAVELIERNIKRLTQTLDGVLELHRGDHGKTCLHVDCLDLDQAAREAVELVMPVIKERGHWVDVQVAPAARAMEADPTRLRQMLINLLHNAAKFTPCGGSVELVAEREGPEVVIRVRDNGVGITPELLPRIFDRFTQADPSRGGLGIGLALVRQLAELHGGSVRAFSEGPGRGSEFVIRLPAVTAQDGRGS